MVQTLAPPRLARDIYHTRTNAYPLVFGANQRPVSCTYLPRAQRGLADARPAGCLPSELTNRQVTQMRACENSLFMPMV